MSTHIKFQKCWIPDNDKCPIHGLRVSEKGIRFTGTKNMSIQEVEEYIDRVKQEIEDYNDRIRWSKEAIEIFKNEFSNVETI